MLQAPTWSWEPDRQENGPVVFKIKKFLPSFSLQEYVSVFVPRLLITYLSIEPCVYLHVCICVCMYMRTRSMCVHLWICGFVWVYARMCLRVTTVVMRHHDHKQLWGKGLFCLHFHITGHHGRIRDRNSSKAGNEARADAEAIKVAALQLALQGLLSLRASRTTSPGVAWPTVNWALPHQLSIKKMSHKLATRPISCIFSVEVPSSQTTLSSSSQVKTSQNIMRVCTHAWMCVCLHVGVCT